MWNDADLPLGYLITFRCYGTWLHGDERGSIDRFHNRYKSPYLEPSDRRRELNRRKLKSAPVTLRRPSPSILDDVEASIVRYERSAGITSGTYMRSKCEQITHTPWSPFFKQNRSAHSMRSRPMQLDKCVAMVIGRKRTARGRIEAAKGTCGTSRAWQMLSTTCSMDRVRIYRSSND